MFNCKYCPYETRYKQILTRHMKTKHKDQPFEKETYCCKYCQKLFASRPSCKRHELKKICCKSASHSPSLSSSPSSSSSHTESSTEQVIQDAFIQSIETPPPVIIFKPLPPPIQIPEIVAESDFEESPLKNKLPSPHMVQRFFQSPMIRWVKYIGCALWIFHMIRRRHQSSSKS